MRELVVSVLSMGFLQICAASPASSMGVASVMKLISLVGSNLLPPTRSDRDDNVNPCCEWNLSKRSAGLSVLGQNSHSSLRFAPNKMICH